MSISTIKLALENHRQRQHERATLRIIWDEKSRETIYNNLVYAIDEAGLSASVELVNTIKGYESVALQFSDLPSPFSYADNERQIVQVGPRLEFAQLANGTLRISLYTPFLEGVTLAERRDIESGVHPDSITFGRILSSIEALILVVTEWEDNLLELPV